MLLTRTFVSAAVFTAAEGTIAKLAFIFLLWGRGLFGRRVGGLAGSVGSHVFGRVRRRQGDAFFSSRIRETREKKTAVSCLS